MATIEGNKIKFEYQYSTKYTDVNTYSDLRKVEIGFNLLIKYGNNTYSYSISGIGNSQEVTKISDDHPQTFSCKFAIEYAKSNLINFLSRETGEKEEDIKDKGFESSQINIYFFKMSFGNNKFITKGTNPQSSPPFSFLEFDKTIEWVGEKDNSRFYNTKGLRSDINYKTDDGTLLYESTFWLADFEVEELDRSYIFLSPFVQVEDIKDKIGISKYDKDKTINTKEIIIKDLTDSSKEIVSFNTITGFFIPYEQSVFYLNDKKYIIDGINTFNNTFKIDLVFYFEDDIKVSLSEFFSHNDVVDSSFLDFFSSGRDQVSVDGKDCTVECSSGFVNIGLSPLWVKNSLPFYGFKELAVTFNNRFYNFYYNSESKSFNSSVKTDESSLSLYLFRSIDENFQNQEISSYIVNVDKEERKIITYKPKSLSGGNKTKAEAEHYKYTKTVIEDSFKIAILHIKRTNFYNEKGALIEDLPIDLAPYCTISYNFNSTYSGNSKIHFLGINLNQNYNTTITGELFDTDNTPPLFQIDTFKQGMRLKNITNNKTFQQVMSTSSFGPPAVFSTNINNSANRDYYIDEEKNNEFELYPNYGLYVNIYKITFSIKGNNSGTPDPSTPEEPDPETPNQSEIISSFAVPTDKLPALIDTSGTPFIALRKKHIGINTGDFLGNIELPSTKPAKPVEPSNPTAAQLEQYLALSREYNLYNQKKLDDSTVLKIGYYSHTDNTKEDPEIIIDRNVIQLGRIKINIRNGQVYGIDGTFNNDLENFIDRLTGEYDDVELTGDLPSDSGSSGNLGNLIPGLNSSTGQIANGGSWD